MTCVYARVVPNQRNDVQKNKQSRKLKCLEWQLRQIVQNICHHIYIYCKKIIHFRMLQMLRLSSPG